MEESHKILVVGTGRSGTHWLGWTLDEHPDVRATIEKRPIFRRVTAAALDPAKEAKTLRYLRRRYAFEHARSKPRHYLDKSHPNLWLAEPLADMFPDVRFVAMRRDPYATVASMLLHSKVMAWQRNWRRYPVPNRFLGITPEIAETYDQMPEPAQCALRWKAHSDRIDQLAGTMGDRFIVVEYEDLAAGYQEQAERIWSFLGMRPIPLDRAVKHESLDKWRAQLDADDIEAIRAIVGFPPSAP